MVLQGRGSRYLSQARNWLSLRHSNLGWYRRLLVLQRPILIWDVSDNPEPQAASNAPMRASHSTSRSSVQQFNGEADAKSHCGTDQVVWGQHQFSGAA